MTRATAGTGRVPTQFLTYFTYFLHLVHLLYWYFTAYLKLRFQDTLSNDRYGSRAYSVFCLLYLLLNLVYLIYLRTQQQIRVEGLAHVMAHLSENRDVMSNLSNHS